MPEPLFDLQTSIRVRALFVGQRINLKAFEGMPRVASNPLVIKAGAAGYAALHKYGAVVLFNLAPVEEVAFVSDLGSLITDAFEKPESEDTDVLIDPDKPDQMEEKYIRLKDCNVEHLQIISDVLAKSVVLAYYESQIAKSFDGIEPMAGELQQKGRSGRRSRELLRHIGQALLVQSKMIGRVQIEEKPDLLWDRPDLERFFKQLCDEYEIPERLTILRHKLDLIHQTAETLLGLLQDKRSFHVEWYIVILIVMELLMSIGDKIF
jgi:uncharacterized Rmd1/YagE family protein